MSASLVGSEMCIRDSPGALQARACHLPDSADSIGAIVGAAPPVDQCRLCLLYTSDAADDM
eukprot:13996700-Alexandrium_andersonii.AAC.1